MLHTFFGNIEHVLRFMQVHRSDVIPLLLVAIGTLAIVTDMVCWKWRPSLLRWSDGNIRHQGVISGTLLILSGIVSNLMLYFI